MSTSAAELENILQRPPPPEQAAAGEGTRQTQRMAAPVQTPNVNQTFAEAAAVKYKKDKKRIQKACRDLEGDKTKQQGCSCVIL
jgi:hypothetical protein